MQIKWLRSALKNLDDEAGFIAQDDSKIAQVVVQQIQQAISLLSDDPALGHPGRVPGTRELIIPKTRFIVPYRVRPVCNALRFFASFTLRANRLSAGKSTFFLLAATAGKGPACL